MFKVNIEKCIGCGLCIKDCLVKDIQMLDGKANIKNRSCFKCGHCVAICPVKAVVTDEYAMEDVVEYEKESFDISAENLLNFIKYRRTIRQYKEKEVENEKLLKIIEAGRFTPTATNSQDVGYVVVKNDISKLREMTMETLKVMGEKILETSEDKKMRMYAKMWLDMHEVCKENPKKGDKLFYNATSLIVVTAKNSTNGDLASGNMELMTNALGLGAVYCGFFIVAAQQNKEIAQFLEIGEDRKIVSCLVVGYPDVKYKRTAPRKCAEISWR
ncbi:MAG: nitroreductase family protein [Fusobacteriaceae bacterium]